MSRATAVLILLLDLFCILKCQEFSLTHLHALYMSTAGYNDPCDMDFHEKHVAPIYAAESLEKMWVAKYVLNQHIAENPDQAHLSCYGLSGDMVVGLQEIVMECSPYCRDPMDPSKNISCCQCVNQGPLVYVRKPHKGCVVKESVLGDECDPLLGAQYKIKIQQALHMELKDAKRRRDYVDAIVKYGVNVENFIQGPQERRLLCTTDSKNMECNDEDYNCTCINEPPYFRYTPAKDGKHCEGQEAALCNIVGVTVDGSFEQVSQCAEGLSCEEAIPGLACDDPLDSECYFNVTIGEDEDGNNITTKILFYDIRACGGAWTDKPRIQSDSVSKISAYLYYPLLCVLVSFYYQ